MEQFKLFSTAVGKVPIRSLYHLVELSVKLKHPAEHCVTHKYVTLINCVAFDQNCKIDFSPQACGITAVCLS